MVLITMENFMTEINPIHVLHSTTKVSLEHVTPTLNTQPVHMIDTELKLLDEAFGLVSSMQTQLSIQAAEINAFLNHPRAVKT